MCKSKAEGGRRCPGHMRKRIDAAKKAIADSEPDTPARARAEERLRLAEAQWVQTRPGIEELIDRQVDGDGSVSSAEIAGAINRFLATAKNPEKGTRLRLRGGRFTVLKANDRGRHTVLDVADNPQTCRAMSDGMQACYDRNAIGKQVTVVPPGELRDGFQSRFVILDGLGGVE